MTEFYDRSKVKYFRYRVAMNTHRFYHYQPQRVNPYNTFLHGASRATDEQHCTQFKQCGIFDHPIGTPIQPLCPCTRDCCASSGDPSAYACVCGDVVQVKPNTLGATNALRNCIPPADWSRFMG